MQCPVDRETLIIAERSGAEIDYCPKCRRVWLDRGELDKIIERSTQSLPEPRVTRDSHVSRPYKKRRESFLGDAFDF